MNQFLSWLRYNTITIILSLLLSLIVWVIAFQSENQGISDDINDVDVSFVGLPDNYRITNNPDRTANITLFAQEDTWRSLNERSITAEIDLSDFEPGTWDVPIETASPQFTTITAVDPPTIAVVIESIEEREMPIQTDITGEAAVGFRLLNPRITPNVATIQGPESLVQSVSQLQVTVPLGAERRQDFQEELPIVALDTDGNPIDDVTITPTTVEAVVRVQREADIKEVSVQPIPTNRPLSGYTLVGLASEPNSVILQGDPTVLEGISVIYTEIFDLSGLTEDTRFTVNLEIPDGVRVLNAEEREITSVTVNVSVEPIITVRELILPVEVVNLGQGLTANLSTQSITVILSGPQRELESLIAGEDVTVVLDLQGLSADTYQLVPTIEIVGFEAIEVSFTIPSVITVDIVEE